VLHGRTLDGAREDTSNYPSSGNTRPYFQQRVDEACITRTNVPAVGVTSTVGGGGEVPKSLEMIEASVNI
jgi:hypothetical protein